MAPSLTLRTSYYVGLLSAAEVYGASPYAVMVAQKRRPITVGRHEVVFHTRVRIEAMSTRWHESPEGRFRVSTPELTALDLIQRESMVGGMARVLEVLRGLWGQCTPEGFATALYAMRNIPVAQRLGALMVLGDQSGLLAPVARWLKGQPARLVVLEGTLPSDDVAAGSVDPDFKVWIPATFEGANT